ncbi:MAG: hypothetical protein QE285_08845 [Aquabacterium sp.]|nr:hypothetical protein [Aquabacterium sp.]
MAGKAAAGLGWAALRAKARVARAWVAHCLVLAWVLLSVPGAAAQPVASITTATRAELFSRQGQRQVNLPHVLAPEDFAANGGRVRYRVTVDLAQLPAERLGILVRKLNLSGQVSLNGHWVGACGSGDLERLICHYRSFVVEPAPVLWRQGRNDIDIEVYAIPHLANGLAPLEIGPADELLVERMRWRMFWQVEVVRGLTWLSVLLGVIALCVGLIMRRDPVYLWFGCVALTYALSNINVLVIRREVDMQTFGWIVFSTRLVSIFMLIPSLLMLFDKAPRTARRVCAAYVLLALPVIWWSGNNNLVVMALYAPLLVLAPMAAWQMLRWTWQSRLPRHLASTGMALALLAIGVHDWLRIGGQTHYESVYYVTYAYGMVMVLFGSLLIGLLASSLNQSRSMTLEAHQRLLALEVEKTKFEERERILQDLQDLHDGFGSQLSSARFAAEHRSFTQHQLRDLLAECMADLYLVIDTLGNHDNSLADAFADLRFRTSQRVVQGATAFHWSLQLQAAPALQKAFILQVLRIAQEALNNAMKHAQARNVWVRVHCDTSTGMVELLVQDDGIGLAPATPVGSGLASMQRRANRIGASISTQTSANGTTIHLRANVADGVLQIKSTQPHAPW